MKSTEIHKIHVPGIVTKYETAKKATPVKVTPVKQSPKIEEQKDKDQDQETPASVPDVSPPTESTPEPQKEEFAEPAQPVIYDPPEWYLSNQLFAHPVIVFYCINRREYIGLKQSSCAHTPITTHNHPKVSRAPCDGVGR